jgi:hypothetical protein
MTSLKNYLETCCQKSNYESDYIEASIFNSDYKIFCEINRLDKLNFTENNLKSDFGIQIIYKIKQLIVRKIIDYS